MLRLGECTAGCGACCRDMWLEVAPVYGADLDVKRWLTLHNVGIRDIGGKTWAHFDVPCSQLTPEGMCNAFGTSLRPEMCADFPQHPGQLALSDLEDVCSIKFIPLEEVEYVAKP